MTETRASRRSTRATGRDRETARRGSDSRDGVRRHLVAIGVKVLDLAVIRPLMRDIVGGGDRTPVRVLALLLEQGAVKPFVQVVDRVVERQQHYLRYLFREQVAWNDFANV